MNEEERELQDKVERVSEWFKNKVVEKLTYEREVKGKGDWTDVPISHLLRRLLEEVGELADALLDEAKVHQIISECADVSAIAMMIANNLMGD